MFTRKQSLFSVIAITNLPEVPGKETKQCFNGPQYWPHENVFDQLLPANQPKAAACTISTLAPSKYVTFIEWARTILDVPADTPFQTLGKSLKEQGHIMTLPQVEYVIEALEQALYSGVHKDNYFFVENEDGNISVGCIFLEVRRWYTRLYRFVRHDCLVTDHNLLVRNLDASKLDL